MVSAPFRLLVELLDGLSDTVDRSDPPKARVDGLTHSLQTATRAERAGAETELVVVALVHDVGRVLNDAHHGEVAAAMAHGRLSRRARFLLHEHSRWQDVAYHRGTPTEALGLWDAASFDPDYPTEDLAHFLPRLQAAWR